jgi:large conductance mechanosensitive channel
MGFIKEFKEFAMRGNVVDMAVGVIIGAAFGNIVTSMVSDVLMPPIGFLLGGSKFTDLAITLKAAVLEGAIVKEPAVMIHYGKFIQVVVDFMIIAFIIFMMIKLMNTVMKKKEEKVEPAAAPEPSEEVKLLSEIRDLLKK